MTGRRPALPAARRPARLTRAAGRTARAALAAAALAPGAAFAQQLPAAAVDGRSALPVSLHRGAASARQLPAAAETVAEIRVHGNRSVPDAEIVALAGVAVGDACGPDLPAAVRRRLEASGRFETVDVRRRFRSLSATGRAALVIVVRERPGARWSNPVARALAGLGRRVMAAPLLEHEEGYGVAYGALTSVLDAFGPGTRLSVPATWGGHRRAALELEAPMPGRVIHRLRAAVGRGRRRNPHFDAADDRTRFRVEVERRLPHRFRLRGEAARERVRFADEAGRLLRSALLIDYGDFRERPAAARRDTVVVRAGIERLDVAGGAGAVVRPRLDARIYASAGRRAVVAGRLLFEGASAPLPSWERALLGGSPAAGGTLRGWPVGAAVGDRLAAASIELRLPVTSLLSEGRIGLRFFYDTAAAYDAGLPIRDARFRQGAGAGVFIVPPRFGLPVSVDVARDFAGGARTHVSAGFGF